MFKKIKSILAKAKAKPASNKTPTKPSDSQDSSDDKSRWELTPPHGGWGAKETIRLGI